MENFAASCPQRRFRVRGAHDPLSILASEFRIEQLLDKLVDNAVAFNPVGSEIAFDLMRTGSWVQIQVGNQGPLIPDELRERVFESMFSSRETCRSGQPHLGLGLTIVRLITERLGGKVRAGNRSDGTGPCFTIELPIAESRE